MRIIQLQCESDRPCFDQRVHEVAVESEDAANWYAKPTANPNCPTLQWPKFAWKEVENKTGQESVNALALTQAQTLTLKGVEIHVKTELSHS